MSLRWMALALLLVASGAQAEPTAVASGAYPEGLMWHGGRIYFTEMGADRVTVIERGATREFWRMSGCGPTQIVPFGPTGFVVDCHLGRAMVEVSATGVTGRKFSTNRDGQPLQDPNAAVSDGQGGAYFSDAGIFDLNAPSTGRVYHLSAMGVMTEVVGQIHYANGVNFDPATRTLYVSEHLARRVLALTLDNSQRVTARRVLSIFAQLPATRQFSYSLAGPDGHRLAARRDGLGVWQRGGCMCSTRAGQHRSTRSRCSCRSSTRWPLGRRRPSFAGGAFQNTRPPFEGAVVRFSCRASGANPGISYARRAESRGVNIRATEAVSVGRISAFRTAARAEIIGVGQPCRAGALASNT